MPAGPRRLEPTPARVWDASAGAAAEVLTPAQVASWREKGFCLVDGVLDAQLLSEARDQLEQAAEEHVKYDFGGVEFPAQKAQALNRVATSERMAMAVAQLLECSPYDLRLYQSSAWVKHAQPRNHERKARDNFDQRMHMDYPNHTLTHPPPWNKPSAVELIVYYDDCEECGGHTAVVPREGDADPCYAWPYLMPGVTGYEPCPTYVNDREHAESLIASASEEASQFRKLLYEREVRAWYRRGTILFYRHDTWHRGTPLRDGARRRFAHNLVLGLPNVPGLCAWNAGTARHMYAEDHFVENLVIHASPLQRSLLGFPQPGDASWTQLTIDAVKRRYGNIDMAPYEAAMHAEQRRTKARRTAA